MVRRVFCSAIVLLTMVGVSSAAPVIVVGEHDLQADTADQTIEIYVSGGESVSGLNLFVQVGDGGPELSGYGLAAGSDGPSITGVELKPGGGIFAGIPDSQTDNPGIPQVKNSTIAMTGGGSVSAEGLLAVLTIDTRGFHAEDAETTWDLKLKGVLPGLGPWDTDFAPTTAEITDGSITVVPEPASVGLLVVGGVGLVGRRRRTS